MYSKEVLDFMKILISFAGDIATSGGMQRACITLANGLSARGHSIHICYGDTSSTAYFFKLNKVIEVNSFLNLSGIENGKIGSRLSSSDKLIREILRLISRKKARAWNEHCKAKIIEPGIKRVIEEYSLDNKTLVCIGDHYNDIEMLKMADIAICPKNAVDEVKNICEYVADDCHNNAIKGAIEYLRSR